VLGALLGLWWTRALVALSPTQVPRLTAAHFGVTSLAFTFAVATLTAIVFGLGPALSVSGTSPQRVIGDGRSSAPPRAVGARRALVAVEVALSLTLLAVAGLMVLSFARLLQVDPGFSPGGTVSLRVTLPASRYAEREKLRRFQEDLRARFLALPGVREAGSVQVLPLSGGLSRVDFTVEGSPPAREEDVPSLDYRMVSPGYFRAAGIPLVAGRELTAADGSDAPPVVLVSRRLAERYFPGRSAVGERLLVGDGGTVPRPVEIVGVVGDVRDAGLDSDPGVTLYVPLPQVPEAVMVYARNMFWVLRTATEPQALKKPALAALRAQDGMLPATAVQTLDEALSRSVAPRRFNLLLVELFALAALVLSALGVYAVSAQTMALRRRELAIRLALGAAPSGLLRLVLGGALRPVGIGVALGLVGALLAGRSVSGLLYRVSGAHPGVLLGAAAVLGGVALIAVWVPARRAARADPLSALAPDS
jgi:predicted permease